MSDPPPLRTPPAHGTVMTLTSLTEHDARLVCSWRYPAPYDVYDHPDFEEAATQGWAIADAKARVQQFRGVWDDDRLVGFSRLFERGGRWLLGVGMDPELTGRGLGHAFMLAVLDDVARRHTDLVELEVRAFNERALATYRHLGLRETERRSIDVPGGPVDVVVMSTAPRASAPTE